MARENFRKIKLLKLLEMLRQSTDEQHPMSTSSIIASLAEMEITCDRRTLSQDIATLNDLGYEIMTTTLGHEKAYYVEDRNFSIPELKILIDAVHASSFITEKKSEELINKIASLAGSHRADVLKRNMVCFNTRKHSNERIFYNVNDLEDAILRQKKVLFRYFDLNEKCERVYRRDGHRYVVEPIALIFNEDNYYLTCYSARHDNTSNYRILKKGKNSIREIAKLTGVSVSTVQRVKAAMFEKWLAPALKDLEQGNICRQREGESVNELLERIIGEP